MRNPRIEDHVVLLEDLPGLGLYFGDVGVVRDAWFVPHLGYQVEFRSAKEDKSVQVALTPEQIQLATPSPFDPDPESGRSLYF